MLCEYTMIQWVNFYKKYISYIFIYREPGSELSVMVLLLVVLILVHCWERIKGPTDWINCHHWVVCFAWSSKIVIMIMITYKAERFQLLPKTRECSQVFLLLDEECENHNQSVCIVGWLLWMYVCDGTVKKSLLNVSTIKKISSEITSIFVSCCCVMIYCDFIFLSQIHIKMK